MEYQHKKFKKSPGGGRINTLAEEAARTPATESLSEKLLREAGLPLSLAHDEPIQPDNYPLSLRRPSGQGGSKQSRRSY